MWLDRRQYGTDAVDGAASACPICLMAVQSEVSMASSFEIVGFRTALDAYIPCFEQVITRASCYHLCLGQDDE